MFAENMQEKFKALICFHILTTFIWKRKHILQVFLNVVGKTVPHQVLMIMKLLVSLESSGVDDKEADVDEANEFHGRLFFHNRAENLLKYS